MFAASGESLAKMRVVMKKMSGTHFHEHLHVIHDVADVLDSDDLHYAEIGTYHGCSAMFAAAHPKITRVTSIDPFVIKGQEDAFRKNIASCVAKDKIHHMKMFSQDVNVQDLDPIDILVIDGCHKYKSVIRDFDHFKGIVKPGGYVLFDDYHDSKYSPQVKPAVDDIVKSLDPTSFEVVGTVKNSVGAIPPVARNENNTFFLRKTSS